MFPTKFDLINDGKKVVDNFPQYERELQNSIVITFSNVHLFQISLEFMLRG